MRSSLDEIVIRLEPKPLPLQRLLIFLMEEFVAYARVFKVGGLDSEASRAQTMLRFWRRMPYHL